MIRQERVLDFPYIKDDPVRPNLSMEFRISSHREVYSYVYENEVVAVICVAYTKEVPITIEELQEQSISPNEAKCAIFYTVWSYKKGFGRSLIIEGIPMIIKRYSNLKRFVTLSPKTEMAYQFHTKNGANHIANNPESDNYEYTITKIAESKVVLP